MCMAKSALHGNKQWQGGARQQPACIPSHILPHIPPQVPPHASEPPKNHLYLPHNQEAISICDFSGACVVDSKIPKASRSPHCGAGSAAQQGAAPWARQLYRFMSKGFGFMVESKNAVVLCQIWFFQRYQSRAEE